MNRIILTTILILSLMLSVAAVSAAAAQPSAPTGIITPDGKEVEPNDDFDQATFINWEGSTKPVAFRSGLIDRPADVDFYQFEADSLDMLTIDWKQWGSPVVGQLSLYDHDRNLLAEATCTGSGTCLQYAFAASAYRQIYYLRVRNANGLGGLDYNYQFTLTYTGKADPNEPNNSVGTATPIAYNQELLGALSPCGDDDYFTFNGIVGETIEIRRYPYFDWQLVNQAQQVIASSNDEYPAEFIALPATGVYTLRLFGGCEEVYTLTILRTEPEPNNNTMAGALPVAYGDELSDLLMFPCDDVDFYRFTGSAGDEIRVYSYVGSTQLLDSGGTPIGSSSWDGQYAMLPADGDYYLRFATDSCDQYPEYWFSLNLLGNNEPNDTPAQAYPIEYDQEVGGVVSCTDVDYFTFDGRAGEEVRVNRWGPTQLLDANQQVLAQQEYGDGFGALLPTDGRYYVKLMTDGNCEYDPHQYQLSVHRLVRPLYFSFTTAGVLKGVRFAPGDVVRYWPDTGEFEMYLDMSDLGLGGNLTAFDRLYGNNVLLGFSARYAVKGLGPVLPQDLVETYLYTTGPDTTAGPIQMYFKGANAGLTTSGERLGSVARLSQDWGWNRIYLTTTGRAKVGDGNSITLENEDFAWFNLDDTGFYTAGWWRPYIDGSLYGLGPAAIVATAAAAIDDMNAHALWFIFDRAVTFGGIRFDPGDIANCLEAYDEDDLCNSVSKYFDASEAGIGSYRIDALEVGDETR